MDGAVRLRLLQFLQDFQRACQCLRTWRETDRLVVLLSGILEQELLLHRFGEHLHGRSPEEAAWTISRLWDQAAAGDRRVQGVCLGLLDLNRLARVVPGTHLDAVRNVLEEHGEASAGLLAREIKRTDAAENGTAPPPKEPVGYRISLARRPVQRLIERFLFDPEPQVVQTVLANPRLIEADVVRLAASRRATPEVLEAIAEDGRWIARYPIKLALVNNPATPSRLVLTLLPHLLTQDLRELAEGASHGDVREQAAALLRRRSEGLS
jgi:hypothetical protein